MELGYMIDFLLSIDSFSLEEISRGICRKSYLSMCRSGEREMNAVVFYYIIRRLFLSPNRFNIILNTKEYQYFKLIDDIYNAISSRNYGFLNTIDFEEQEKKFTQLGTVIRHDIDYFRYIYYLEVQSDRGSAYHALKSSVEYMLGPEDFLREGRYGTEELNRFLNYIQLSLDLRNISQRKAKKILQHLISLLHIRSRDPREEAKLYPRIVCFILNLIGDQFSYGWWIQLLREALDCLIKTSNCNDLPEVLRLLVIAETAENNKEALKHQKWYESVLVVYREAETDHTFNVYDSHDRSAEITLINEYLRRSRLNTGRKGLNAISQTKLLDGSMTQVNYSKIESGKSTPSRANFESLTQKLNVSGDYKQGEIISNDISDYWLITDIRTAGNQGDAETLEKKLKILEEKLDMDYIENRQFLDQKRRCLQ